MIYILFGNDTKKKNVYLKRLYKNNQPIFIPVRELSKEMFFDQAQSVSLFGEQSIFVFENFIGDKDFELKDEEISHLKDSQNIFIFKEDKLLAPDLKKYKKHATIEDLSSAVIKQTPKINVFGIADAFARKDKIQTWVLFREAVSAGVAPEEVSGILFWKIKTMILNSTKVFTSDELKNRSSELVSIYHKAHGGEIDFTIGLEQFILNSLNK
ncbi:MAG: hypothetical protein WCT42_00550 [Candidatus Paceibacterota bacterium]